MKQLYILIFLLCFQFAAFSANRVKLVILHTNDTHSQVEPSEKSSLATSDMGGYARRIGVIEKIRSEEKNVLLFDAGDYSQGSPYFNFFNGRIEIDALNRMKYDAVTMGNHEFDNGIDTLAAIIQNLRVPLISSNYDVTNSVIRDFVKPWIVIKKAGLKIGVMALNVNPESLILESNIRDVNYIDPVAKAQEISEYLKNKEKCDLIICLSHLGSDKDSKSVNDFEIARKTKFIDVIIGGHSHTLLENTKTQNAAGRDVIIAQMAKSGFYLGRIDLLLTKK
ncbi:MAG: metallophosphatase [Paludibacter sp.]|nr:metallophosphatase [Paludibacter sp.]